MHFVCCGSFYSYSCPDCRLMLLQLRHSFFEFMMFLTKKRIKRFHWVKKRSLGSRWSVFGFHLYWFDVMTVAKWMKSNENSFSSIQWRHLSTSLKWITIKIQLKITTTAIIMLMICYQSSRSKNLYECFKTPSESSCWITF